MSEKPTYVVRTYAEGFDALDTLGRALDYLCKQYSDAMVREEAQAHFDARAVLINRRIALLNEMELEWRYGSGQKGKH